MKSTDVAIDFIKVLLDHEADSNAKINQPVEGDNANKVIVLDESGATPFLRAVMAGDLTVMRLLLRHGADPKATTRDKTSALMLAAGVGWLGGNYEHSESESLQVMKLLLELGADVNAANDRGLTPLHGAAHKGSTGAIQFLVNNGGRLDIKDKPVTRSGTGETSNGRLPLDWAVGVNTGAATAVRKPEAEALIRKLMVEKGIPIPDAL